MKSEDQKIFGFREMLGRAVLEKSSKAYSQIRSGRSWPSVADNLASDPNIHYEDSGKRIALFSGQGNDKGKIGEGLQSQGSNAKNDAAELQAQPLLNTTSNVVHDEEFMPLSGNPYFHCIMTKTNVKSPFQMVIPVKLHPLLPSATVPVVLTFRNTEWKMNYYGDRKARRFDPGWRNFVVDNNLKIGDGCVFELMKNTSEIMKFRVQILRCDIPDEFLRRVSGLKEL